MMELPFRLHEGAHMKIVSLGSLVMVATLAFGISCLTPSIAFAGNSSSTSSATNVTPPSNLKSIYPTMNSPVTQSTNMASGLPTCPNSPIPSNPTVYLGERALYYVSLGANPDTLCPNINGTYSDPYTGSISGYYNLCPTQCTVTVGVVSSTFPPVLSTTLNSSSDILYDATCPKGYTQTGMFNMQNEVVPKNTVKTPASPFEVSYYTSNGWSCPVSPYTSRTICLPWMGANSQPQPPVGLSTGVPEFNPAYPGKIIYNVYIGPGNCYTDQFCYYTTTSSCTTGHNIIFYYNVYQYTTCTCTQPFCTTPYMAPSSIICTRNSPRWSP